MSTPLSEVYDAFFIKSGQNYLYKEDQVYQFLKTGISKSKKTTYDDLIYNIYTDNIIITVCNAVEFSGNIELIINSSTYTISLVTTDTKSQIIDKIKAAIQNDWTIDMQYLDNPRMKITKSGISDIQCQFNDIGDTNLDLVITRTYDGEFISDIQQDTIELISLNMLLEQKRQRKSELDYIKTHIGSKDFSRLPDKKEEYNILQKSMKDLQDEIFALRQEFYSYNN